MSTAKIPDIPVGSQINEGQIIQSSNGFKLPYRIVGLKKQENSPLIKANSNELRFKEQAQPLEAANSISLHQLGILEGDSL